MRHNFKGGIYGVMANIELFLPEPKEEQTKVATILSTPTEPLSTVRVN